MVNHISPIKTEKCYINKLCGHKNHTELTLKCTSYPKKSLITILIWFYLKPITIIFTTITTNQKLLIMFGNPLYNLKVFLNNSNYMTKCGSQVSGRKKLLSNRVTTPTELKWSPKVLTIRPFTLKRLILGVCIKMVDSNLFCLVGGITESQSKRLLRHS